MSQAEPHTTDIGGQAYTMSMLPPMKSHRLLVKIVQMVGPSLGPVFDMFFGKSQKTGTEVLDQEVPAEFFTKAAGTLFDSLDEKILDQVIKEFKAVTVVEGLGLLENKFDAHFLGKLDEMYHWLAWGMSVQWGKVFGGLAAVARNKVSAAMALANPPETKEKASTSPTPSTG